MPLKPSDETYISSDLVEHAQALDISAAKARHVLLSRRSGSQLPAPSVAQISPGLEPILSTAQLPTPSAFPKEKALLLDHQADPHPDDSRPKRSLNPTDRASHDATAIRPVQGNITPTASPLFHLVDVPVLNSANDLLHTLLPVEVQVITSTDCDNRAKARALVQREQRELSQTGSVSKGTKSSVADNKKAKKDVTVPLPPPPPAVRQRITRANLERLLQDEAVIRTPLSDREQEGTRQACGFIQQEPTSAERRADVRVEEDPEKDRLSDYWADLSADDEEDGATAP